MARSVQKHLISALVLFSLGFAGCLGVPRQAALEPSILPGESEGVIVAHHPSPSWLDRLMGNVVYTTSPSIVVLPSGDYLISYNIFGQGSGADVSGTTYIYLSVDQGESWTHLTTLSDMKRGSLFVHHDALYIWGYRNNSGDILIRRSTDNGYTWTTPTDETNGLLRVGSFGGTPNNPVVFAGRIWIAQGGRRVMSAPVEADLLRASSWTLSNAANTENGPYGPGLTITEAQIVASPRTGVVLMPKVGGLPNTVLIRALSPNSVSNPLACDWVSLPGGEKKFGASYDPRSDRFYVLSNPVLPEHVGATTPQLIRNAAALLSSSDLIEWEVVTIFLYSPHVDYEAFQYLNFDFDGDDLVIVSRTALDMGGNKPPRGHDSNLITFHRIRNFRSL